MTSQIGQFQAWHIPHRTGLEHKHYFLDHLHYLHRQLPRLRAALQSALKIHRKEVA